MRLLKIRPLLLLLPLVIIAATIAVISLRPRFIDNLIPATVTITPSHRGLWNSRGLNNYEITVETVALPSPPVALELTIRDGVISSNSILACDKPSAEYPAQYCETIRKYYSWMGNYTIEELFDLADSCLSKTRELMSQCSVSSDDPFQDFTSIEAMRDAADTCEIQSSQVDDYFCFVAYDPHYVYPRTISSYNPAALDSFSTISIKNFHLTQ